MVQYMLLQKFVHVFLVFLGREICSKTGLVLYRYCINLHTNTREQKWDVGESDKANRTGTVIKFDLGCKCYKKLRSGVEVLW